MSYTPPAGDAVTGSWEGAAAYAPPSGDAASGSWYASARQVLAWDARLAQCAARQVIGWDARSVVVARQTVEWGFVLSPVVTRQTMPWGGLSMMAARQSVAWGSAAQAAARQVLTWDANLQCAARQVLTWDAPERTPGAARQVVTWGSPDTSLSLEQSVTRLLHLGRELPMVGSLTLSIDEGSPHWICNPELAEVGDYARVALGDPFTLALGGAEWALICDGRQFARDADSGEIRYSLSLISPAAALGPPWALERSVATEERLAKSLVQELLGWPMIWQIVDWPVPAETFSARGTPLELARSVVAAVGGLLESQPDGGLVARASYPVSPPEYGAADAIKLTDREVFACREDAPSVAVLNRYAITSETALDTSSEQVQVESEQVDGDPHRYLVRAYPYPMRSVTLAHTGDAHTQIGPRQRLAAEHTELVEFKAGASSVAYPVADILDVVYQHAGLGAVSSDGAALSSKTAGYSMAWVTYRVRGYQWEVSNAMTETIQFLAEEGD